MSASVELRDDCVRCCSLPESELLFIGLLFRSRWKRSVSYRARIRLLPAQAVVVVEAEVVLKVHVPLLQHRLVVLVVTRNRPQKRRKHLLTYRNNLRPSHSAPTIFTPCRYVCVLRGSTLIDWVVFRV